MNNDEKLNLRELLKNNIVEVDFTKLNGEKRIMRCTLLQSYLPQTDVIKEKSEEFKDSYLSVWDTVSEGWRSFRYESVNSYLIVDVD